MKIAVKDIELIEISGTGSSNQIRLDLVTGEKVYIEAANIRMVPKQSFYLDSNSSPLILGVGDHKYYAGNDKQLVLDTMRNLNMAARYEIRKISGCLYIRYNIGSTEHEVIITDAHKIA